MMALDFPASPTVGQKYPQPPVAGVPVYTWDGEKWATNSALAASAAPATAVPLMDQPTGLVGVGTKYAREDHVHPKIYAAPFDVMAYSGMQVNGLFEASQEKGSAETANGAGSFGGRLLDGWRMDTVSAGGGVIGTSQAALTATVLPGFTRRFSTRIITAQPTLAATEVFMVSQMIEGYRTSRLAWGTQSAQPITIAFWSAHSRVGTHNLNVCSGTGDRSYCAAYTQNVAGVYEYKTVTIPGCTDGANWDTATGIGLAVRFCIAAGSNYVAPAANAWYSANYAAVPGSVNGLDSTANGFHFSGFAVFPGSEAPSAARSSLVQRPYSDEIILCKRYWENGTTWWLGYVTTVVSVGGSIFFTEKRIVPTLYKGAFSNFANAKSDVLDNPTLKSARHTCGQLAAGSYNGAEIWIADARF
jgi:hypothetical protein